MNRDTRVKTTSMRKDNEVTINVTFENYEQACYAFMFLDRCGFDEFFQQTEPHLSKEKRNDRAYKMRDAISKIESALTAADISRRIYE
jgi:hypothetical protein